MDRRQREEAAWAGYVGSQTPQDFLSESRRHGYMTVEDAVRAYVRDLPNLFSDWDDSQDLDEIADLLIGYIRRTLGLET